MRAYRDALGYPVDCRKGLSRRYSPPHRAPNPDNAARRLVVVLPRCRPSQRPFRLARAELRRRACVCKRARPSPPPTIRALLVGGGEGASGRRSACCAWVLVLRLLLLVPIAARHVRCGGVVPKTPTQKKQINQHL